MRRHALIHLGCSYGQGYLFGRPTPAEEVADLLTADATASPAANLRRSAESAKLPYRNEDVALAS